MNRQLIATGAICFALGFGTHLVLSKGSLTTASSQTAVVEHPIEKSQTTSSKPASTLPETSNATLTRITQTASSINKQDESSNKISTTTPDKSDIKASAGNIGKLKYTQRTEISDESIDELIPKPFNNRVKHLTPELKSKYANYLLTENQNDADKRAENFLNDALNHGQLAGIAEVNFIGCKAGLCEVRLIEQAVNQTMPTVFKLMTPYRDYLQDAIASSTSDGEQVYIHYLYNIKPAS